MSRPGADDGLPVVAFRSAADWEHWLENNHATAEGVWMKLAKKATGIEPSAIRRGSRPRSASAGSTAGARRSTSRAWEPFR